MTTGEHDLKRSSKRSSKPKPTAKDAAVLLKEATSKKLGWSAARIAKSTMAEMRAALLQRFLMKQRGRRRHLRKKLAKPEQSQKTVPNELQALLEEKHDLDIMVAPKFAKWLQQCRVLSLFAQDSDFDASLFCSFATVLETEYRRWQHMLPPELQNKCRRLFVGTVLQNWLEQHRLQVSRSIAKLQFLQQAQLVDSALSLPLVQLLQQIEKLQMQRE